MAETDADGNTPKMSIVEVKEYRTELRNELEKLQFAQAMIPSEYKASRIRTLRKRLDLPVD